MTFSVVHTGPDSDGFPVDGPLVLGIGGLSIINFGSGSQRWLPPRPV
jgi:hypothetical protein